MANATTDNEVSANANTANRVNRKIFANVWATLSECIISSAYKIDENKAEIIFIGSENAIITISNFSTRTEPSPEPIINEIIVSEIKRIINVPANPSNRKIRAAVE